MCISEHREVADVAQKPDYEGRWAEAFRKCSKDERAKGAATSLFVVYSQGIEFHNGCDQK